MQIDKGTILQLLQQRGDQQTAQQAEQDLPEQVDTDRDAGLLERFGINIQDLIGMVGGGGRGIPGL